MLQILVVLEKSKYSPLIKFPRYLQNYIPKIYSWVLDIKTNEERMSLKYTGGNDSVTYDDLLFHTDCMYAKYVEHITDLIIYGFSYPYLSLIIFASASTLTTQWQLSVSCYIDHMVKKNDLSFAVSQLEEASKNSIYISFRKTWKFVVSLSTLMVGLFIIDISWSDPNFPGKYIFILFLICIGYSVGLWLFVVFILNKNKMSRSETIIIDTNNIELKMEDADL